MSSGGLRALGRDSLVYGVLDVANRFVGIFLVPLYTRVLAPADYGALDLVLTLGMVVSAVLFLGLDSALLYRYNATDDEAERRRVATTAFALVVAVTLAGAAVMAALRDPIASAAVPGVPGAGWLIALAAGALPLQAANQVQFLLLRVRRAFAAYAALSLGLLLLTVALNLWFVVGRGMGVEGILLAQVVARIPAALFGMVAVRRDLVPAASGRLAGELVRYGGPLVVGNVTYWALLYAERYALARLATLAEAGLFGVAMRVATFVTLISMAIDLAWTPFAHSIQRDPGAPRVYARVLLWYLAAAGGAATVLAVFAREALVVVATPPYYAAHLLVGPIAAALVLRGAANIVAIGALVTRRTHVVSGASVASALLDVGLLLLLVPPLGAMGAALATLSARVGMVAWLHFATREGYPVPYPWGRIARMAAVYTAAAAAGMAAAALPFWTAVAVKALVVLPLAAAGLVVTGALPPDEVRALWGAVRRGRLRPSAAEAG